MGGSSNKQNNQNLLVMGFTQLIQLDHVDKAWKKDDINSSIDFELFSDVETYPQIHLWCPQDTLLMKRVLESLISQIYFEGLLYILAYDANSDNVEHRNNIHWLMNEETMRQAVLFVLLVLPQPDESTDAPNEEALRIKLDEQLRFSDLDSKQTRQIYILNMATSEKEQEELKKPLDFTVLVMSLLTTAEKTSKVDK